MIIDPSSMSVQEWTSQMAVTLDPFGHSGTLDDPRQWRGWARNVVRFPGIQIRQAPDPDDFSDWKDWAIQFCLAVEDIV